MAFYDTIQPVSNTLQEHREFSMSFTLAWFHALHGTDPPMSVDAGVPDSAPATVPAGLAQPLAKRTAILGRAAGDRRRWQRHPSRLEAAS